jgi:hypothetical protein
MITHRLQHTVQSTHKGLIMKISLCAPSSLHRFSPLIIPNFFIISKDFTLPFCILSLYFVL